MNEVDGGLVIVSLEQFREVSSVSQVGVLLSLVHEVVGHLLVRLEEVLLEGSVGVLLEVLVLDVLQEGSFLLGSDMFSSSLDGFSLVMDFFNNLLGSFSDFVHKSGVLGLVSDELVIRAGLKSLSTKSRVVHHDGLKVLEGVLVRVTEDSEVKSGIVGTRKGEVLVRASDVESSHERISPIVELEDKSVVVLEVEDSKRSHSSEDGLATSHLLDFSFIEVKNFDTLDFARFEIEGFHF